MDWIVNNISDSMIFDGGGGVITGTPYFKFRQVPSSVFQVPSYVSSSAPSFFDDKYMSEFIFAHALIMSCRDSRTVFQTGCNVHGAHMSLLRYNNVTFLQASIWSLSK